MYCPACSMTEHADSIGDAERFRDAHVCPTPPSPPGGDLLELREVCRA
jgi:hypothetical protein